LTIETKDKVYLGVSKLVDPVYTTQRN